MFVSILQNISENVKQSKFYIIMADEVTDVSNHEDLVICIEILEERVDPEVRCRVVGVHMQMQSFNLFFGIQLGVLVLRHTDYSSSTLQHTNLSCYEAQQIAKVCLSTLKGMREEAGFHMFFEKVRTSRQKLEVNDPKLPKKRKVPSCYEHGEAPAEFVSTVEEHYRQIFYQTIDMVTNCIHDRFQ